jgi:hypothetical protein
MDPLASTTKRRAPWNKGKLTALLWLLLGHSKLESTVRYLGVEIDDALELVEQTELWGVRPRLGERFRTFPLDHVQ